MRGGLQSLVWDGVLHMFIAWYFTPLFSGQAWKQAGPVGTKTLTSDLGKTCYLPQ